jgi:ubiquinone/menaquinone biosynthesis C-methylase UbiE
MSDKPYFDEVAHKWDKMRESFFSERVREKAISIADVQSNELAADIGAGTGFITEGLIQKGLRVIAVDQSEAMLREMKRKFRIMDVIYRSGVDYIVCKVENLPIESETVDIVFANMLLHHVENPGVTIKEMVRILKPGGRLVITDLDKHNFEFLKTEHHDRWMGFKREDVKSWFIEAGLNKVRVECVGECCCSCEDEDVSISIFATSGEK